MYRKDSLYVMYEVYYKVYMYVRRVNSSFITFNCQTDNGLQIDHERFKPFKRPFSIEIMQHTISWKKISKYLSILEARHVKPECS